MRPFRIVVWVCSLLAGALQVRGAALNISSRSATDFVTASPNHSISDTANNTFSDNFSYTDPGGNYIASVIGSSGPIGTSTFAYSSSGADSAAGGSSSESYFDDLVYFTVDQTTPFILSGDFSFPVENSPLVQAIQLRSESGMSTSISDVSQGVFNYTGTLSPGILYFLNIQDGAIADAPPTGASSLSFSADVTLTIPEPSELPIFGFAFLTFSQFRRNRDIHETGV